MANFEKSLVRLMPKEIDSMQHPYENNPDDPGGETTWGVIKTEAVANGYTGSMKDMPIEFAEQYYKKKYWDLMNLDDVEDQDIADQIFQASVNQGETRWEFYVQRACNQLMPGYAPLLAVDGDMGVKTVAAVNQIAKTDRVALSKKLFEMQEKRYDEIVINNPKMKWARNGWHNRAEAFRIKAA